MFRVSARFLLATSVLLLFAAAGSARPPVDKKDLPKKVIDPDRKVRAVRDSMWYEGQAYRQWIHDQNSIGDQNSNLDQEISFIEDGKLRIHSSRVYFYKDIDLATRIAVDCKLPLAFYLFDHTCRDCLYLLPELYREAEVVEASHDFVNCYVEIPREHKKCMEIGMMESSLTVQFFLPGLRRLRVVDSPDKTELLEIYGVVNNYAADLSEEELLKEFIRKERPDVRKAYR